VDRVGSDQPLRSSFTIDIGERLDKGERMIDRQLEEYKLLRAELESIGDHTYTTLNVMLAAIGVIASAGFAENAIHCSCSLWLLRLRSAAIP